MFNSLSNKHIVKFLLLFLIVSLISAPAYANDFELSPGFSYQDISLELKGFINGKSFKKNEYVKTEDLKFCRVNHIGFDGEEHDGELVVASKIILPTGKTVDIAKEVLEIFKEIYDAKYPIEKIKLIDYYDADDEKSMIDNNSSAFIFKCVCGTNRLSLHSYGLAIDINPFFNPCFHPAYKVAEPAGSEKFLNRRLKQQGLIKEGDDCYNAFVKRGWEWGGSLDNPNYSTDYMHLLNSLDESLRIL